MKTGSRCTVLSATIVALLDTGIRLSADDVDFIDSTFMNPAPAELQQLLEEDADGEAATLLELIFFPDETVRFHLEDTLEQRRYQREDCLEIQKALVKKMPAVSLIFPDGGESVRVTAPQWAWHQFVRRLNIHRRLDRRLLAGIDTTLADPQKTLVKLVLRDGGFQQTDDMVDCLCTVVKNYRQAGPDLAAFMRFVVGVMEGCHTAEHLLAHLIQKQKFLLRNLRKAKHTDEYLRNNTVETLRAQGVCPPFFDTNTARRDMKNIDKLCRIIYGRALDLDAYTDVEQCRIEPGESAAEIVRKLTSS